MGFYRGQWYYNCNGRLGRAIAQAVSGRVPTAADRVRCQVKVCCICGKESGIRTRYLQPLPFAVPIQKKSIGGVHVCNGYLVPLDESFV
jgi:hypothetical protein